jgi:histidinol-phosphate aminotransferase
LAFAGLGFASFKDFASPAGPFNISTESGPIRLNSNENPYGPSPAARKAIAGAVNISNRYQWTMIDELAAAIAGKNKLKDENVLVGAGSTEVIDTVIQLVAEKKGSFVMAGLTYGPWAKNAERLGLQKIAVPLKADKSYDLPAMLAAIRADTKMIHICNPNNPTGSVCGRNELLAFINEAGKKAMVLVDEAYIDYADDLSVAELVKENENLVLVRTFSKIHGLAGARIGYALAHPSVIEQLSRLRTWTNAAVGAPSMAAALASLGDDAFLKACKELNTKARQFSIEELKKLNIPSIASHTNFIYFSLLNYKADYFDRLKIHNISGTRYYEEQGKWSRITVGTMDEMKQFINALS